MPGLLPAIRRVEQLGDTGCAVACVAMVAGVSYTKAALHVKGRRTGNLEAYITEMARGLRSLGFTCRLHVTDFRQRRLPAILMFEWDTCPGSYHCVVYDPAFGGRYVDPGYGRNLGERFYLDHWRRLGCQSVAVTGRR